MLISLNWLKQYINFDYTVREITDMLTQSGLEVEGIEDFESIPGGLKDLIIGEVKEVHQHPDADKLKLTKVDTGNGNLKKIVCGAPNVEQGQKVIIAPVGTTLYPKGGEPLKIKKSKIRGEESEGMICAEDEIGLGDKHEGIVVLDTQKPNGTPAAEYFEIERDVIIEIGLTPNRADAASHMGVARELKAIFGMEEGFDKEHHQLRYPKTDHFKPDNESFYIDIEIENPEACPRYNGLTISNITVKPSPHWLQNRLRAIGLNPVNNIVDATNFVLHELGQPLHAFDANKISGNKVIVKTLPQGTNFVTLDSKERKLNDSDLMICNEKAPMCIAGVFGGLDSGVTADTTHIFLESAYFNPDYVRKTAQTHGLKTDASFRFERGTDPDITLYALKRAAMLIQNLAGGEISSHAHDEYVRHIENFEVHLSYKNLDRLIGKKINRETIRNILRYLDISITKEHDKGLDLAVPPYRVDVQREADVVEEILRIYGYNRITTGKYPGAGYLAQHAQVEDDKIKNRVSDMLSHSGFYEILNNSLTRPDFAESLNQHAHVEIVNKLSNELGVLRQNLMYSGLEAILHNINRKQRDLKFYEFGRIYENEGGQNNFANFHEKDILGIWITGNKNPESWLTPSQKAGFYDISAAAEKVLESLGICSGLSKEAIKDDDMFMQGLAISRQQKTLVRLGLINSRLSRSADIDQPVYYAWFDWQQVVSQLQTTMQYREIPKYPEVRRDLSLILDKHIKFEEIKALARQTEDQLLYDIDVFDVYEGENIGENHKSYALKFILQDPEKTLTDQQIDQVMNKMMETFEQKLGAIIRK